MTRSNADTHTFPSEHRYRGRRRRDRRSGGLFFGTLLVVLGAAGLLRHAGLLPPLPLWQLWPLLPIWIGLSRLAFRRHGSRWSGILPLAVGAVFGAHYLGYLPLDWSLVLPALVLALGLQVVLRSLFSRRGVRIHEPRVPGESGPRVTSRTNAEAPLLFADIAFSGAQERFEGRDFGGGTVRCLCAGYEMDLRGAEMTEPRVLLEVDVVMAGIEMRIPRGWRVEIEVQPTMGAVEDHTNWIDSGETRVLVLTGRVVLGGVEIKN